MKGTTQAQLQALRQKEMVQLLKLVAKLTPNIKEVSK